MDLLAPVIGAAYAGQTTTYTGTAGSVTGWAPGPRGVMVWCTTAAYVVVGDTSTTATTSDLAIPANVPVCLNVPTTAGNWRVSAIQIASGGSVYAKPIAG